MPDPSAEPARFRGRPLDVGPDEPLARALARRGRRLLGRSLRYHRPRAPFCGVGHCTNCLVRVNGVPNVRACRYVPSPGDRIVSEAGWPSPEVDLLAAFDLLFPRGLDALHGFRRPAWATPLYQRAIRRLAGFGRLPDAGVPPAVTPGEERRVELAVVGAGRSARALLAATGAGPGTLVVERDRALGLPDGVESLDRTTAAFLPPPEEGADRPFTLLAVGDRGRAHRIRARTVVVATGGYDASLLFAGSDRPGVLTAEGALALAPVPERPPFRRAVLVGGGERVAGLLALWGTHVEAVIAPGTVGPEVARAASEIGVPIYPRTLLLEATGGRRIRRVTLAARGGGARFSLSTDAVVLAHRRLPNSPLLFQAGASMAWRSEAGAYFPALGPGFATSVPGLYAVGEVAGFTGAAITESGRRLAPSLGGRGPVDLSGLTTLLDGAPGPLDGYYPELVDRLPRRSKTVACPCEDVLLGELADFHARGYRGIEVAKRYTGLGTGLCQGRYCVPEAVLLLAAWERRPAPEVGRITARPPVVPVPLGALAGLPEGGARTGP